jgi:hypothetical protein
VATYYLSATACKKALGLKSLSSISNPMNGAGKLFKSKGFIPSQVFLDRWPDSPKTEGKSFPINAADAMPF